MNISDICQVINEFPTSFETLEEQTCTCNKTCTTQGNCCQYFSAVFIYEDGSTTACLVVHYNVDGISVKSLKNPHRMGPKNYCYLKQMNAKIRDIIKLILQVTRKSYVILKGAFCVSYGKEIPCRSSIFTAPLIQAKNDTNATSESDALSEHIVSDRSVSTIIIAAFLNISIFFLVLHLIIFQQLTEKRNLPAKNLAAFCGTLLLYYMCYEIAIVYRGCKVMALFCHLLLISCYTWMLILSYDCWHGVYLATKNLRQRSGKQTKRFLIYCFVCWLGVPTIIVVMALYFRLAPEDTISIIIKPMPNELRSCSRMEIRKFHVFTVVPALCLLLGNVGFYAHSALMICSQRQQNECVDNRSNLKICIRLAIMVNLSWILEFVGLLTRSQFIRFCYFTFVVSQGIFIFFMFTFRENNLRQLLNKHKNARLISSVISSFVSVQNDEETHC